MSIFVYSARDGEGQVVRGIQEAVNEAAAVKILQGNHLVITNLVPLQASQDLSAFSVKRHSRIKVRDRGVSDFTWALGSSLMLGYVVPTVIACRPHPPVWPRLRPTSRRCRL